MFELQITLIECFDYSNSSDYSYTSFFVAILMNPVKGNSASQKKLLLTLQLSITKERIGEGQGTKSPVVNPEKPFLF